MDLKLTLFFFILHSRIDLTSEDLLLDNKYEAYEKAKARKNQKRKAAKRTATSSKKKKAQETTFHYIAYVPVGGLVWELDGLETQPRCIGMFYSLTMQ